MPNKPLTALFLVFVLLLAALPIGLAQEDNAAPAPPQPAQADKPPAVLTPLAIGNTWVYENKADGLITTERIEGMVLFDDKAWYLLRTAERPIDEPDAQPDFVWESWLARIEGVDMIALVEIDQNTGTLKLSDPSGDFRFPVAKGDTYRPIENDRFRTIEVIGVDVPIKTKAGEFKCIAYQEHNADEEDIRFVTYIAPGVGIVRYTTEEAGATTSTDLIQYKLAKTPPKP